MSDLIKIRKAFKKYHKKHEVEGEGGYGGYFSSHTNKELESSIYDFYEAGYIQALKDKESEWSDEWICPHCKSDLTLHKLQYCVNEESSCQKCEGEFYLESRYRTTKV